jgi:hypothetical protein
MKAHAGGWAFLLGALWLASLQILADRPASVETTAELRVQVREQVTGQLVPARIYLVDDKGVRWAPEGAIKYDKSEEHHFITVGSFQLKLPAGRYSLAIERGPEYRLWSASIEIQAGEKKDIQVMLDRWVSMNERGWYSGDLHNHRKAEEMPQLLLAEDLNLAPTLTDWIWEDKPISFPPTTSEAIRRVDATHVYSVLDKEVERLNYGPGAVDLLALTTPIPFQGDRLYPPNDRFCRLAHDQGGYVDAEKIVWRDVCALVALDQIDFAGIVHNHFSPHGVELETESWGMIPKKRPEYNTIAGMPLWSMDVYYRFLNCGFRLPVSAGSASGVKAAPLGYNRVYVRLREPVDYRSWFRSLKAGRSFATNGPILFLNVNGEEPGSVLHFSNLASERLKIRAEASSAGELDRLEVLFKGQIIKTARNSDASGKLIADFESEIPETGWVVARCFERAGKTIRFAHTSPVYVEVQEDKGIVRQDAQFFLEWIERELAFYRRETRFQTLQEQAEMLRFFEKAREVYARLAAQ